MEKVIIVNWQKSSATRHRKDCGNVARVGRAGQYSRTEVVPEAEYGNFLPEDDFFPLVDHSCIKSDDA